MRVRLDQPRDHRGAPANDSSIVYSRPAFFNALSTASRDPQAAIRSPATAMTSAEGASGFMVVIDFAG
jgi:hypothetical protein